MLYNVIQGHLTHWVGWLQLGSKAESNLRNEAHLVLSFYVLFASLTSSVMMTTETQPTALLWLIIVHLQYSRYPSIFPIEVHQFWICWPIRYMYHIPLRSHTMCYCSICFPIAVYMFIIHVLQTYKVGGGNLLYTVDRESFTLKIICVKKSLCWKNFLQFHSIREIF